MFLLLISAKVNVPVLGQWQSSGTLSQNNIYMHVCICMLL